MHSGDACSSSELVLRVDAILSRRVYDGAIQYKIRWEGYGSEGDTWEPLVNLQDTIDMLIDFEEKSLEPSNSARWPDSSKARRPWLHPEREALNALVEGDMPKCCPEWDEKAVTLNKRFHNGRTGNSLRNFYAASVRDQGESHRTRHAKHPYHADAERFWSGESPPRYSANNDRATKLPDDAYVEKHFHLDFAGICCRERR